MAKRRRYTDAFRANAVVMLQAAGYPDRLGALARVSNELNVPSRTLSRWYNKEQNPPSDILVTEKKADLAELLRKEIDAALETMPTARGNASYRDLGTVTAILIDKIQLLTGKATERVENVDSPRDEIARRINGLAAKNGAQKPPIHANGNGSTELTG